MDFKQYKLNKKEMDDYVSAMLLELEKEEKELEEKEKRLKEMDAPRLTVTEADVVNSLGVNIVDKDDNEEVEIVNRDPFKAFDELLNCYSCDSNNEPQNQIIFGNEGKVYEERKKMLSEIRKAEYNAYLKKKEKLELKKKKELMNPQRVFAPKLIVSSNRILNENNHLSCRTEDSLQQLDSNKLSDMDKNSNFNEYQNRPPSSVQSNPVSQSSFKSSNTKKTNDRSLISVQSFGRRSSVVSFGENSDIRHEIAALYKEQLDKQVKEKQKLNSMQKDYAELCNRKNEFRQNVIIQDEYAEEVKRRNKLKEVFHIQDERFKNLEDFVRKDNELRKSKFLKYITKANKENIQTPIPEIEDLKISTRKTSSMSEVLCSLSDIRRNALRTQKFLDQQVNR